MNDRYAASHATALRERLLEALELKELPRAGWRRVGIAQPESVASHSWGVAWLVLALCPPEIDRGRALAMAVVHDLPEVRTGDITPHDQVGAAAKQAAERAALQQLVSPLSHGEELKQLWLECEQETSPEGRFVKGCDRLDMALQAERYAAAPGADTSEFIESAVAALQDPDLLALVGRRSSPT